MRINSILEFSEANGPGKRGVVWVQGCSRQCEGCFNPQTQDFEGGVEKNPESVLQQFDLSKIQGLTVSGGEPFSQKEELLSLLKQAKSKGLNTLVYSGFTYEELFDFASDALEYCDYLIDGPYKKNIPSKCRWAGSGNQRFLELKNGKIVNDLTESDAFSQTAEIIIEENGNVVITGFIKEDN
ncbi:MAG: radical SAM protein [Treponema sp.]|nr:radical SAM protein [Treponema sp.]